jgi:hypothetical protein
VPEELRLGCAGIWSDSSEIQAPPGAMRDALNVRIRRPNVVEPRPGLPPTTVTAPNAPPRHMLEWNGGLLIIADTELHHVIKGGAQSEVTDPASASLSITYGDSELEEVSDGVMVPTDNGVYYVDADNDAQPAGLPQGIEPVLTPITGSGVPDGDTVAVRSVFVNELLSERLVVSAPSAPVTFTNNTGSAKAVNARVNLPDDILAGMRVQLYRTDVVTPPDATGDEMSLVADVTLVAGDITAGYVDAEILASSAETLGASLYTNETQEGVLEANYAPLPAKRVAWYNQMAFYADLSPRYAHRWTGQASSGGTDGFGFGVYAQDNLTFGSGVTTITGLSTGLTDSLAVGMYVSVGDDVGTADTYFAANTTITAVYATSIDISAATLAVGSSQLTNFHRTLTIAGNSYILGPEEYIASNQAATWSGLQSLVNADGVVRMNLSGDELDTDNPLVELVGDASFSASSLAGTFKNIITEAGVSSSADGRTWPARLSWSKTLQPESVPLLNFLDIGSHVEPILALEATRDSLFVFKRDGCWRVTGFSPETLTVDEYDRTLRLISPLATTTHRNDVWAWTTRGILRINDGGAQNMSDNTIRDQIADDQQATYEAGLGGTVYGGLWMGSSETEGLVVAGLPETGDWNLTLTWYLYESRTGAWVRWEGVSEDAGAPSACGEDKGELVFGTGNENDNGCYLCWADYDNRSDTRSTRTISTFTANVEAPDGVTYPGSITGVTNASKGVWLEDDENNEAWIIYAAAADVPEPIVSATLTTTPTNGATWHLPFASTLEWNAMVAGNPGQMVHWRNIQLSFSDATALPGVTLGFESERAPTEETIEVRSYLDPTRSDPIYLRGSVTRSHARSKRLRIRATMQWADQDWRLDGIVLTFQPMRGGERLP